MTSTDAIDIEVGLRIRLHRKAVNLSQAGLAAHLGVSFQQVQKYELGRNRISASMLVRTAKHLGVSVAVLVGEAPGAVADRGLLEMLSLPGAVALLQAFSTIGTARMRAAILELARSANAGHKR